MTEVTLDDLSLAYRGADGAAVEALSTCLPSGRLTALLGPSGCGKTTAMKLICGLLQPDRGRVLFGGRDVTRIPTERRGAAMVFQNHLLFEHMSVADNVGFGPRMRGVTRREAAPEIDRMLDLVRLGGMGSRRPAELSGGQQQRVALARALMVKPEVLLLDEPLSSLDAHLRDDMRLMIRDIQRETGVTTLFVTHDQEEAAMVADHVALMLGGRIRQTGAPQDFYARPADREVATFFGGRNFLEGRFRDARFDTPLGALRVGAAPDERARWLTIRPEAVRLGPGENTVEAVVADRIFMGARVRLILDCGGTRLEAFAAPDMAAGLSPGCGVTIHLPPEALWPLS